MNKNPVVRQSNILGVRDTEGATTERLTSKDIPEPKPDKALENVATRLRTESSSSSAPHVSLTTPAEQTPVKQTSPAVPELGSSPRRLFSLDVLRGLAAMGVLLRHVPATDYETFTGVDGAFQFLRAVGWVGVDLFFCLSGFLIAGLIFREHNQTGHFRMLRFWLRRGYKIWPCYFVAYGALVVLLGTRILVGTDSSKGTLLELTQNALINSVFLQNYLDCERWPHSWSLAIEEHFYTIVPLLLCCGFWLARRFQWNPPRWQFPLFVLAFCGATLGLRLHAAADGYDWAPDLLPHAYAGRFTRIRRVDGLFLLLLPTRGGPPVTILARRYDSRDGRDKYDLLVSPRGIRVHGNLRIHGTVSGRMDCSCC